MPSCTGGRPRSSASRRTISAATRKSWRRSRARACLPASSTNRASTACSAFPPRKRAGAFTPRPPPLRCCRRWRISTWTSAPRISASTPCAPAAPAASTSTRRIRRCASPICRPVSSSSRPRNRSIRTAAWPCRSCAPGSTSRSGRRAADSRAAQRKGQIGSGDRSQRIRTYNFPQGRVTDHRIGLTLHKLDAVLEGTALDELIDALVTEHQASELAAMQEGANA